VQKNIKKNIIKKITKCKKEYNQKHKEEISKNQKQYYEENKNEILKYAKEYREENKKEIAYYQKQYYQENKKTVNKNTSEYIKNRRKNDPIYKFMRNISREVNYMLKGKKAGKPTKNLLPFTTEQIMDHMEMWFKKPGNEWMNWGNQGVYNVDKWDDNDSSTWKWQLDHETPVSHFDIKNLEHPENDKDFLKCWDLSNLRPLSAKQNISEGNRR